MDSTPQVARVFGLYTILKINTELEAQLTHIYHGSWQVNNLGNTRIPAATGKQTNLALQGVDGFTVRKLEFMEKRRRKANKHRHAGSHRKAK